MSYYFAKKLNMAFDEAIEHVTEELKRKALVSSPKSTFRRR